MTEEQAEFQKKVYTDLEADATPFLCPSTFNHPNYGRLKCSLFVSHDDKNHYNYPTDVDWPKIYGTPKEVEETT